MKRLFDMTIIGGDELNDMGHISVAHKLWYALYIKSRH